MPLAGVADRWLARLARDTGSAAVAALDGATLLGERAALAGLRVGDTVSAGGGCRLYPAADGAVALTLARDDDRALLPALFADERLDPADDAGIAARIARKSAAALVARGRLLGLAIAAETEADAAPPPATIVALGSPRPSPTRPLRVLDLSALWAGPLAGHLLHLAGAEVTKVESATRPDAMRTGRDAALFRLINGGKASVVLDFAAPEARRALLALAARADIVVEASRPRALAQSGIDAAALVRTVPGLTWITITGHGTSGGAADWVGFGDDCGVAAGLSAARRRAGGGVGFVGDAIADPLTGIAAAAAAWTAWRSGRGGRHALAMRGVAAAALAEAAGPALVAALADWAAAAGKPFPPVRRRAGPSPAPCGWDTARVLAELPPC